MIFVSKQCALQVAQAETRLTVYRLRLVRMQEDIDSYWARAFKFFFLPCDPGGKINSVNNKKVYHSESNFRCMNEMCVNIKLGDVQNIEQM